MEAGKTRELKFDTIHLKRSCLKLLKSAENSNLKTNKYLKAPILNPRTALHPPYE